MKHFILFTIVTILAACSSDVTSNVKESKITITPVELEEDNKDLVWYTGTHWMEVFEINGELDDSEVLSASLLILEDGKNLKPWGGRSFSQPNLSYDGKLITLAYNQFNSDFYMGTPGGVGPTHLEIPENITISGHRKNLYEEYTMEKGKPVYLAYWVGNEKSLRTCESDVPTELPSCVKESALSIILEVKIVDDPEL